MKALECRDLRLHKSAISLGVELDLRTTHTRPLDGAQSWASAYTGQEQAFWEALVGHCTCAGLLRCGSLSAFHCCYQFRSYNYASDAVLRCSRGLLLLGISPWQTRWNECVCQSDDSLTGYGVRVAHWPREQVERAGRISDWSRF